MLLLLYGRTLSTASDNKVQCGSTTFSYSKIIKFAKSQVDYILGNNPLNMSYMVGCGTKYPQELHHRGSFIPSIYAHPAKVGCDHYLSSYYSSNDPNPNVHVRAIVRGPNSYDEFNDVRSDYSHLEPATYMNAAFAGSLCGLLSNRSVAATQCSQMVKMKKTYTVNPV